MAVVVAVENAESRQIANQLQVGVLVKPKRGMSRAILLDETWRRRSCRELWRTCNLHVLTWCHLVWVSERQIPDYEGTLRVATYLRRSSCPWREHCPGIVRGVNMEHGVNVTEPLSISLPSVRAWRHSYQHLLNHPTQHVASSTFPEYTQ